MLSCFTSIQMVNSLSIKTFKDYQETVKRPLQNLNQYYFLPDHAMVDLSAPTASHDGCGIVAHCAPLARPLV